MKLRIYAIYDKVACECGPLFEAKNDGVAMRQMQRHLQNVSHTNEYSLLYFGTMDHDTLMIDSIEKPEDVIIDINTPMEVEDEQR